MGAAVPVKQVIGGQIEKPRRGVLFFGGHAPIQTHKPD
jgi:hypothetical protein